MYAEDLCCDLTRGVTASESCETLLGGIEDIRIACLKNFSSYTEVACSSPTNPGTLSAVVATDPISGDPVVPFYNYSLKRKTGQHSWNMAYDIASSTKSIGASINFQVGAKDDAAMCAWDELVGQEVVVAFKYRGSDNWYLEGWKGGLWATEVAGGSGLDTVENTAVTISGEDLDARYVRYFNTDVATTDADIDALTN